MLNKSSNGFGLVEVVVGLGIITFVSFSFVSAYNYFLKVAIVRNLDVRATLLAEESVEVVKFLRDESWSANIATMEVGMPYFLSFDGLAWATTTDYFLIDSVFERAISVGDVYRDDDDNISDIGVYDENTKFLTATVSFATPFGTTTRSISTYLTNLFDN